MICLAKAVDALFNRFYPYAFHAVIGVVVAATIVIVPFDSFIHSISALLINIFCVIIGSVIALALNKFNQSISRKKCCRQTWGVDEKLDLEEVGGAASTSEQKG